MCWGQRECFSFLFKAFYCTFTLGYFCNKSVACLYIGGNEITQSHLGSFHKQEMLLKHPSLPSVVSHGLLALIIFFTHLVEKVRIQKCRMKKQRRLLVSSLYFFLFFNLSKIGIVFILRKTVLFLKVSFQTRVRNKDEHNMVIYLLPNLKIVARNHWEDNVGLSIVF